MSFLNVLLWLHPAHKCAGFRLNYNIIKGKRNVLLLSFTLLFILNTLLVSATIDLVSPENNTYANQQSITFEYYVSLDNITNTSISCALNLDSEIDQTDDNITNHGFNEFTANLSVDTHTWSITCNSVNNSENSEERVIAIDVIEPTVILISPLNNTQINSSSADLTFIVINTPTEESGCDVILDGAVNKSIVAEDSESTTTTLTELSDGLYEWRISCSDQANNSETSETRTFKINTTPEPESEPEFSISIEKTEYVIGEYGLMTISAPNSTSIRVEVCPDQPGFVECEVPAMGEHIMNYPFQEYLPFTNEEGKYILEAYFNYTGTTEIQELDYEIKNNINIDIESDEDPRKNVPLTLEAYASGGVGTLEYTWHLSSGSKVNKKEVEITYTKAGNYTETVFVKDAYNNTRNKSITMDVSNAYSIEVVVKDSVTNKAIKKATVEVEDEQKETDTNGKVQYYLEKGRRDIMVLKENYSIYLDELDITKDKTFTIQLEPITSTEPKVTLIRPKDNSVITGPSNELAFRAEYNNTLNCSIYINENNDGFFIYLGSLTVKNNNEQKFGVVELENKTYWWKVECIGNNGKTGVSKTWEFRVGKEQIPAETLAVTEQSEEAKTYNDWVKEFERILDELENLPTDEREAADALGITNTIKDSIKTFKNTIRDLDSISFRNDLSEQEKQAQKQKLVLEAQNVYQKSPVSITVLKSDSFVDYIDKTELTELLKEYIKINNISTAINQNKLLDFLEELQQEVVISTKTKNTRVTYKDGTTKGLTLLVREIKTYNLTDNTFILEVIPKNVVNNADEILSTEKYEVIKQDPIISFELKGDKDKTLIYYFEKSIDLELLKNIRTAVFINPESVSDDKITGFSTKKLKLPKIKGIIFIPVIVILLGSLIFVSIKYNGLDAAKYVIYKLYNQKSLHYINIILNEINDELDVGDVEKALALYEEAKSAYSELSTIAKNDAYERIEEVANKIKDYYATTATDSKDNVNEIKGMINNITALLNNAQLGAVLEEYKRIEAAYNQLDDEIKEMLHPMLVSLGNKIQIMIDNEKNKI
ncbi:hypothetical protein KY348_07310 [Candidatus Woesearchaeota archaeon]|nr:hypothetical protein [Candidatus Woesearchaeota archaeon]